MNLKKRIICKTIMRKLETQKTARLAKIIAKDNKKAIFQVSSESEVHEALGLPLGQMV